MAVRSHGNILNFTHQNSFQVMLINCTLCAHFNQSGQPFYTQGYQKDKWHIRSKVCVQLPLGGSLTAVKGTVCVLLQFHFVTSGGKVSIHDQLQNFIWGLGQGGWVTFHRYSNIKIWPSAAFKDHTDLILTYPYLWLFVT